MAKGCKETVFLCKEKGFSRNDIFGRTRFGFRQHIFKANTFYTTNIRLGNYGRESRQPFLIRYSRRASYLIRLQQFATFTTSHCQLIQIHPVH